MGEQGEVPAEARPHHQARIALLFLFAMAAAVALAVVYAVGGQPQLEGIFLFLALGSLAVGLGLWAHHFLPEGNAVEERHPLASTPEERAAFVDELGRGEQQLTRRWLLLTLLGGGVSALGAAALFPIRSLGPSPEPALKRTAWASGKRLVDDKGVPVHRDDIPVDGVVTVFPEGNQSPGDSQVVLIRVREGELKPRPGRESWAPDGYIAFSKVCTHAGCPVGLYQATTHQLVCPCHQSLFDVTDGARPVFGPATRSLPQLPVEIGSDGFLRAQSDFTEPIGPGYWNR
jgi:ubiquinol-cytochrome c reductase iron-sulfur subunit